MCRVTETGLTVAGWASQVAKIKAPPDWREMTYRTKTTKNVRKKEKAWEQIGVELKESGKWFCFIY